MIFNIAFEVAGVARDFSNISSEMFRSALFARIRQLDDMDTWLESVTFTADPGLEPRHGLGPSYYVKQISNGWLLIDSLDTSKDLFYASEDDARKVCTFLNKVPE